MEQRRPSGFLVISATDVTYFDPYLDRRIDKLEELTRHYEPLRGKIRETYELIDPKVQTIGKAAVLTYHYVFQMELYRGLSKRWRSVENHPDPLVRYSYHNVTLTAAPARCVPGPLLLRSRVDRLHD